MEQKPKPDARPSTETPASLYVKLNVLAEQARWGSFFDAKELCDAVLSRVRPVEHTFFAAPASRVAERDSTADYLRPKPVRYQVAFTDEFWSAVAGMDRKLQGRVLEALRQITVAPTAAKGDTIKPLSASAKGLWRYRIGDYRLVYRPSEQERQIVLMAFGPRSSVYA